MTAEPPGDRTTLSRAALGVVRARHLLATGRTDDAAREAARALADARTARAPWWIAKALRLRERSGRATSGEVIEAASIERGLGAVEPAP
jgi:hypothetical protein